MPKIKSAIKKARQDRKRERQNDTLRLHLKRVIGSVKKQKTETSLKEAFSVIDKASKKHLIHKHKAARLKSTLSKLVVKKRISKIATKSSKREKKTTVFSKKRKRTSKTS